MKQLINEINKNILYYETAKKQLETYIEAINSEFNLLNDYNPINHIKTRIKTTQSIIGKLNRKGLGINIENVNKLNDIVGARIIVDFIENIFEIVDKIRSNDNLKIIEEKDYIKNPKPSVYRGYHIVVSLPISVSGIIKNINCEIQIRTNAMDFWSNNEHKLNYKSDNNKYKNKWLDAAKKVWDLDTFMNELYIESKKNSNEKDFNNIKTNILKSIDKFNKIKDLNENYG